MNALITHAHLLNTMNQSLVRLAKTVSEQDGKIKSLEQKLLYIDTVIDRTMNVPQVHIPPPSIQLGEDKIKDMIDNAIRKALEPIIVSLNKLSTSTSTQQSSLPIQQSTPSPQPPPAQYVYDPTPPPPLPGGTDLLDAFNLHNLNNLPDELSNIDNLNLSNLEQDDIIIMTGEQSKSVKTTKGGRKPTKK